MSFLASPLRGHAPPAPRSRGFSLIELLVSLVIAMALIIALGTVSSRFEESKRQNSSSSDLSLSSGYMAYDLDRQIRSAGSGFINDSRDTFGCLLMASRNNAQILPRAAAFPAPFTAVPGNVRMMPVLIHPGAGENGSDVLQTMTGASGMTESSLDIVSGTVTVNQFRARSSVGVTGGDLLLVAQSGNPCMLQQAADGYAGGVKQEVDLGGVYAAGVIGTTSLTTFGSAGLSKALALGDVVGRQPRFQLMGINANSQLVTYDLLRIMGGDAVVPVADNVVDMRIRYGIDTTTNNAGIVNAWTAPTGNYTVNALSGTNANTQAVQDRHRRILAVRIAMVLRSDRIERDGNTEGRRDVSPATLTMFAGLPAAAQVTYNVPDRRRKHTLVEFTVPLRNNILTSPSRTDPL